MKTMNVAFLVLKMETFDTCVQPQNKWLKCVLENHISSNTWLELLKTQELLKYDFEKNDKPWR